MILRQKRYEMTLFKVDFAKKQNKLQSDNQYLK